MRLMIDCRGQVTCLYGEVAIRRASHVENKRGRGCSVENLGLREGEAPAEPGFRPENSSAGASPHCFAHVCRRAEERKNKGLTPNHLPGKEVSAAQERARCRRKSLFSNNSPPPKVCKPESSTTTSFTLLPPGQVPDRVTGTRSADGFR